ncbi:CLC4G-like protein [Mya arenaria]|uniref:CLC4G-like protein n=1 Tax=Mya arenaria TaxID=6604 RepID=A0ABY7DXC7_MYAAR|nr:CLC4G-like protein [Mya arenaria]
MKFVMILAFSFILKVALGNTVLQSSCQLDLETTVSKSLELLKNALGRGECSPTCPNGWLSYESSCFLFGNAPSTFADAETFCEDRDSHLVYIKDNSENTFLKDTAREMKLPEYPKNREQHNILQWNIAILTYNAAIVYRIDIFYS